MNRIRVLAEAGVGLKPSIEARLNDRQKAALEEAVLKGAVTSGWVCESQQVRIPARCAATVPTALPAGSLTRTTTKKASLSATPTFWGRTILNRTGFLSSPNPSYLFRLPKASPAFGNRHHQQSGGITFLQADYPMLVVCIMHTPLLLVYPP